MPISTEELRNDILNHVTTWQKRLKLEHWHLTVKWEDIEETVAETTPDDMYDYATIKFNDVTLLNKTAEYVEKTVIHELLHLHDRNRNFMFNEIEGNLNPEVYKLFERIVYQQTEAFVDKLASCLYDLANERKPLDCSVQFLKDHPTIGSS